jgi:rod shape-determining protein MreB
MFRTISELGIDLGTCNTLIYIRGKGIVLDEPSVVAFEKGTKRIVAVGKDAKTMLWRTPEKYIATRPLRDGVIADLDSCEKMMRYFISKVLPRYRLVKPRMVIGIPSCITEVERRAVEESALKAGAKDVIVIEESLAAAIGADIPIFEPAGHMVCDIGGGTTEVSVISLGGMVRTNAIRVGGDEFNEAIVKKVRSAHDLIIGEHMAERIKIEIGNAEMDETSAIMNMEVKGINANTGLPQKINLEADQVREALQSPISRIIDEIKKTLSETPPELAADIAERGIVMTGGGSLLKGLAQLVSKEAKVPVFVAESPLNCVALGAGKYFEYAREFDNSRSIYDKLNS